MIFTVLAILAAICIISAIILDKMDGRGSKPTTRVVFVLAIILTIASVTAAILN